MDAESVRLTLGTFLTSPGFGGLAAVIAAVFAARSVGKRLAGDRELAKQQREHEVEMATTADSRQRWWEVLFWLDTDSGRFDEDSFLECLAALADQTETKPQIEALNAVLNRWQPE
ncbi:hypothetical protein ON003_07830 [Janibacter hoylei]|uniref:hypothetical protein n=1 Tax=Janibacter hoylei TaxID=364298 RepID=UPI002238FBED|nr:hypothetical protein [Janibacter hoylei]MCW4601505.1 hypothetical protein [Janibacter hoylei]